MVILKSTLSSFITLVIFILYLAGVPDCRGSENTSSADLLRQADSLFSKKNYREAADSYQKILEQNKNALPALSGLGRIAVIQSDWGEAKDHFKEILKKDPDQLEAYYFLGICYRETGKFKALLLRKLDWDKSNEFFDKVINTDSTYRDVLLQKARLLRYRGKYREAIRMMHRQINLRPDLSNPGIQIFRFYRYYIANSDKESARIWLGQQINDYTRYFAGEKLRRDGQIEKADSIFKILLKDSLEMPVQPLLLSLIRIRVQTGEDTAADSLYRLAVNKIKTPVQAGLMFEDIKYILTEQEYFLYKNIQSDSGYREFFRDFWIRRNPLPSTIINFRLIEHFKRLQFAEKYYEYDGFRGWFMNPDQMNRLSYPFTYELNEEFNDKGLVYIRHGEPDETARTAGMDVPANESWLYYKRPFNPQMTFHFIVGKSGNDWRFAPVINHPAMLSDRLTWGNIYYQLLHADALERLNLEEQLVQASRRSVSHGLTTDRHSWEEDIKPLNFPFSVETFKGENGRTLVEFACALPSGPNPEENIFSEDDHRIYYEKGLKVLDRQHNQIFQELDRVSIDPVNDSEYVDLYRIELIPDTYLVAFHARQLDTSFLGGYKFYYKAEDFSGTSLQSSTIQLSEKITPAENEGRFVKNGLEVLPAPSHRFSKTKPLYVYFELYNLELNSQGNTIYTIEYRLKNLDSSGKNLLNLFGLLGSSQKSVTIQSERTGSEKSPVEYLALDVSHLDPGRYELQLTITDDLDTSSVERTTNLILY
ncbi:MAG: GWxTD domain-containing protein [Calditrichaeota bacterium]|nr:GWxTD domain-containing protein [Calditrichota bacterium]RQW06187.1 MAG: GWxTD domain-containing protein [Calditrichota bacterium]